MTRTSRTDPEWRLFEQLVARIEQDAEPGVTVTSPARLRCTVTGRLREVDAAIRTPSGRLTTVECRKRRGRQDVTWIEQLATKRRSLGADKTIAVSASGFTTAAHQIASRNQIELKTLEPITQAQLNPILSLNLVLFWHRRAAIHRIGLRKARDQAWSVPDPSAVDLVVPEGTDPQAMLFRNEEDGRRWSINHLWQQLQEATDPFAGIAKAMPPVLRTTCFPYPGNVTIDTAEGPVRLGDVILTVSLWLEAEERTKDGAEMVAYGAEGRQAQHRLEFTSIVSPDDWRIGLQAPADGSEVDAIRTSGTWPGTRDDQDPASGSPGAISS